MPSNITAIRRISPSTPHRHITQSHSHSTVFCWHSIRPLGGDSRAIAHTLCGCLPTAFPPHSLFVCFFFSRFYQLLQQAFYRVNDAFWCFNNHATLSIVKCIVICASMSIISHARGTINNNPVVCDCYSHWSRL